jgi:tubulin polyglutamylase TTLL6/13
MKMTPLFDPKREMKVPV